MLDSGGGAVLEHCPHRTGAVLCSDKHWHAVLERCIALLECYDSSTAVSVVTGRSGVLGHCKALPYDPVTASVKDYTKCGQFRSSAPSTACQCSHSLSYFAQNLNGEHWLWLHGHCLGHLGKVSKALAAVLLIKARL